MNDLTVLYIDDDEKDARRVLYELDKHFIADSIKPEPSSQGLIEKILAARPDAVVVDFRLSEADPAVHYDGYRVIRELLDRKENFPVFLLTSHQDDAFVEVDDVNVVYEKGEIFKGESTFLGRISNQIFKYKKRIIDSEIKLLQLIERQKSEVLSLEEEKELIRLDSFIEKSLDKESAVPEELKVTSNEQMVTAMLREVDRMVEKVNKNFPG
jgi:CheY-like chemotaxis protein